MGTSGWGPFPTLCGSSQLASQLGQPWPGLRERQGPFRATPSAPLPMLGEELTWAWSLHTRSREGGPWGRSPPEEDQKWAGAAGMSGPYCARRAKENGSLSR